MKEPLPQDVLSHYFEAMKNGDELAREIIIVHHIQLVLKLVYKKFFYTPFEPKELISVGIIGLMKSVNTFDSNRKVLFVTYATKCINNEIRIFMKKEKKHLIATCLDDLKNDCFLKVEETLACSKDSIEDNYELQESYKAVRQIVQRLPDTERYIIEEYFGFHSDQRKKQSEIGASLGLSQTAISHIIKRTLKKIKIELLEQGIVEVSMREMVLPTNQCSTGNIGLSSSKKMMKKKS